MNSCSSLLFGGLKILCLTFESLMHQNLKSRLIASSSLFVSKQVQPTLEQHIRLVLPQFFSFCLFFLELKPSRDHPKIHFPTVQVQLQSLQFAKFFRHSPNQVLHFDQSLYSPHFPQFHLVIPLYQKFLAFSFLLQNF